MIVVSIFVALLLIIMALIAIKDIKDLGAKDANTIQNTITVSGKGEIMVKPDIALISLGVTEDEKTVVAAQDLATKKMNDAIQILKDNGVLEKDIKTTSYNISPRYEYVRASQFDNPALYPYGKQVLAGYTVSQNVDVKIRDLTKAGDILAKVGQIGLDNVSGLQFMVDNEDAVKIQARDQAITDAKTNAKKLAKALGVRLADLVSFNENGNYPIYARMDMVSSKVAGTASVAPEIPTGENTITSNVTLVYEIR
jgi:uncharacterized protein YggE